MAPFNQTRPEKRRLFESLEPRHLLANSVSLVDFLASETAHVRPSVVETTPVEVGVSKPSHTDSRWDWLAGTVWYVPASNLLAYVANRDLRNPKAISDQTIWDIRKCSDGRISGFAAVYLAGNSTPTTRKFLGIVTKDGQIRIEFSSQDSSTTTGIGQMRLVDGQWKMQMQMATGSSLIITHWANMSQKRPGTTPPDSTDVPPTGSQLANNWKWLQNSRWNITDKSLFGDTVQAGTFQINKFRNGYFWGSVHSDKPFNVLGSVTPEGNVLLLISQGSDPPAVRMGQLKQTSPKSGVMTLRTYEGNPAIGLAWTAGKPFPGAIVTLGARSAAT
jgi:hypothetical protein